MGSLLDLVACSRILVCAGPGGVGKTTVAASLGVLAAQAGRKTLVATVDPAPRLVDALDLPDLGPEPRTVPEPVRDQLGIPAGAVLAAARIDAAAAFAALVAERVADAETRARILSNEIYRQITGNLTATQEYAANLSLCNLQADPRHDLLVLDTPPSSSAIDFFQAPARLTAAIESPLVRWLLADGRGRAERVPLFSLRRFGAAGGIVLKRLARLVGSAFLADLGAFLSDFEPVLSGFIEKTARVAHLLRAPDVAVLLVTAPEAPAIDEAIALAHELASLDLPVRGVVINRVLPAVEAFTEAAVRRRLTRATDTVVRAVSEASSRLHEARRAQRHQEDRLRAAFANVPVVALPLHNVAAQPIESLRRTATAIREADGARSAANAAPART